MPDMLPVEEMVVNDESISVSARSWGQGCGRNGLGLEAEWGKRSHTVGALQAAWKRRVKWSSSCLYTAAQSSSALPWTTKHCVRAICTGMGR